ncbi:hypothetical protein [Thermococcus sp. 5-4]|uniref:hypothetical protein n=1 Tax=Thermococcus sp. 5-4 TaxID=2008440 RepID=UPI000B49F669|nr:hypothetical protein [Thermococcus sp. 5-4]ASA78156.1 hypothetical protein CDI07_07530 [Thermococcus sp. 5-4]
MRLETSLTLTIALLLLLASGCISGPSGGTPTESQAIHPGYGEFNAGNVLIGDGGVMRNHYGLVMPVNRTVTLKGIVFSREYRVSSENGSGTTGYYRGKVGLKAYLGDIVVSYAWSGLESRLEPVSELKVEIAPETVEVEPGKNGTFEVRIDTSGAVRGKTYYLYIVAFGEDGWKGWAVVEVKIWGNETVTSP